MKKLMPILIIIVVAVVAVGAWLFLGKGKGEPEVTLPGEIKKEAGEEGESFTGKLKDVVTRGVSMKCTVSTGDFSGTSYIKGRNVYSEMTQEGRESFMIMKDSCMWSWTKDESQGVKTCFETDAWEQEEAGDVPTDVEYRCAPTIFPDSKFNPPANVNFLDIEQLMQQGVGE